MQLVHSFQSEWLKKKRSAASWLVLIGGLLIPLILMIAQFAKPEAAQAENASGHGWEILLHRSWQFMGIFLLPLGVIMATGLVTQLEFRNNAWKHVLTLPQKLSTVFVAKLALILVMLLQCILLFNIGIYLAGALPALLLSEVPYPPEPFPIALFLERSALFFLDCLPIVALQYLLGLQFRNFLVPFGAGIVLFVASMIAINWEYGYTVPYTYCPLNVIGSNEGMSAPIHWWAAGYAAVFFIAAYVLFITRKEKS